MSKLRRILITLFLISTGAIGGEVQDPRTCEIVGFVDGVMALAQKEAHQTGNVYINDLRASANDTIEIFTYGGKYGEVLNSAHDTIPNMHMKVAIIIHQKYPEFTKCMLSMRDESSFEVYNKTVTL